MTGPDPAGAYRAGNYVFTVQTRVPDPAGVIARLMSVFGAAPGGATEGSYTIEADPGRAGNYLLTADGAPMPDVTALGTIVDWIVADVTRRGVASLAPVVCLHAGAVSLGGAGVILPGVSGAGKSTLVAGLVAGGAAYLSDEVAVIEARDRTVRPFPRPLVLDPDSVAAIEGLRARIPAADEPFRLLRYHVTPQDLGPAAAAAEAAPIALVIRPEFEAGAPTTVDPLSRGAVLALLASHLFGAVDDIEAALPGLKEVALVAPGYLIHGGELGEKVAEVKKLVAALGAR